jgi:hypothetical protein
MLLKHYFFLNSLFFYVELNNYIVGTSISFFKYRFNSTFFFFILNNIFYFFNFYLLEKKESIIHEWKKNKYLFFSFFRSNVFYRIKHLKLEGRGYKLYYYLNYIVFKLGYSHLCYFLIPLNVLFLSKKKKLNYKMVSFSNQIMGNLLFRMQSFRIPNTFKKKGIFIA